MTNPLANPTGFLFMVEPQAAKNKERFTLRPMLLGCFALNLLLLPRKISQLSAFVPNFTNLIVFASTILLD